MERNCSLERCGSRRGESGVSGSNEVPPSRVLYIDLDIIPDKSWLRDYKRNVHDLLRSRGLQVTSIRITPSRSKGLHARIYLDKLISAETQLRLQFLLGDDHSRTGFNRARVELGYPAWNKLHEAADWDHLRRGIPLNHHGSGRNKRQDLDRGGGVKPNGQRPS